MPGLSTGTVTLLFTDIEGSTRLLQQLGERYAEVIAASSCAASSNAGVVTRLTPRAMLSSWPLCVPAVPSRQLFELQ